MACPPARSLVADASDGLPAERSSDSAEARTNVTGQYSTYYMA
ncbi:hypothetical protein [Streptomyces jumonjinensis]|nr:hypothetical protein [Streptomyces jumonjinensis]